MKKNRIDRQHYVKGKHFDLFLFTLTIKDKNLWATVVLPKKGLTINLVREKFFQLQELMQATIEEHLG